MVLSRRAGAASFLLDGKLGCSVGGTPGSIILCDPGLERFDQRDCGSHGLAVVLHQLTAVVGDSAETDLLLLLLSAGDVSRSSSCHCPSSRKKVVLRRLAPSSCPCGSCRRVLSFLLSANGRSTATI